MYETQFTIWLQSFSTDGLDQFFLFLSWLGYEQFLQVFIVFLIFGVNIRKGFLLSQVIIWTAGAAEVLKDLCQYPRPFMVDNQITLIGQPDVATSPVANGGASSFWSFLPAQSVETARSFFANYDQSWGIPSGHAAGSIVIWGSLALWFRKNWLWVLSLSLILLIPLSRLYVGMHFIGDLLMGYLLGIAIIWFTFRFLLSKENLQLWLFPVTKQKLWSKGTVIFFGLFVLPPSCALFIPSISHESITLILGANLGFFGIWLRGVPNPVAIHYGSFRRFFIAFVLLGFVLFVDAITDPWLVSNFGQLGAGIQEMLLNAFMVFVGIELLVKMGLLDRDHSSDPLEFAVPHLTLRINLRIRWVFRVSFLRSYLSRISR